MTVRSEFAARFLAGEGVEIGAQTLPLDVSSAKAISRLRYLDRFSRAEQLALYPEIGQAIQAMVEPDLVWDASPGLGLFGDGSLDFLINCHLIEHVPDPLFWLEEVWRVLRIGGRCYLAVPDKEFLFYDADRSLTSLEHLIDDHRRKVRIVEDNHIEEAIRFSDHREVPTDLAERSALFSRERQRSVHVHVWNMRTFVQLLIHFIEVHRPFQVLEVSPPAQNETMEMLFILERCPDVPRRSALYQRLRPFVPS